MYVACPPPSALNVRQKGCLQLSLTSALHSCCSSPYQTDSVLVLVTLQKEDRGVPSAAHTSDSLPLLCALVSGVLCGVSFNPHPPVLKARRNTRAFILCPLPSGAQSAILYNVC